MFSTISFLFEIIVIFPSSCISGTSNSFFSFRVINNKEAINLDMLLSSISYSASANSTNHFTYRHSHIYCLIGKTSLSRYRYTFFKFLMFSILNIIINQTGSLVNASLSAFNTGILFLFSLNSHINCYTHSILSVLHHFYSIFFWGGAHIHKSIFLLLSVYTFSFSDFCAIFAHIKISNP